VGKILVTGLRGPQEEGWQKKVEAFASQIPILPKCSLYITIGLFPSLKGDRKLIN